MMRFALVLAMLATAGCRDLNPAYCAAHMTDPRCPMVDGGDGGLGDVADAAPPICIGEGSFTACIEPGDFTQTNLATNIQTGMILQCLKTQPVGWIEAGQPESCFVAGVNITISAAITARGSRPVVIVASDTLTITGVLDASGVKNNSNAIPAGYLAANCAPFAQAPVPDNAGAGGAAGGSFSTSGGNGGTGNGVAATAAGFVAPLVTPTVLRAGCGGQTGAMGDVSGANDSAGGTGGGAVYLLAQNTIAFGDNASVQASGAGGSGGGHHSGGGGGGSGGMIVLWAGTNITVGTNVSIFANGGGGAGGGPAAGNGNAGSDPSSALTAAGGGTSNGNGNGGNGAAGASNATSGGNANANVGGGGGGGGLGLIRSNHPLAGAAVSPTEVP